MDPYLLLVILLMGFATLDLVVGVSNDAVNFLNSALGSRVASLRTILIIASLGVLIGTVFSSGMMEVARKGVFNPAFFSFHALTFVFVAVMLTDVILLDVYNTLGFPTSTTVSLVFELFGAGTAIGFLSAMDRGLDPFEFSQYINVASTMRIIKGIFSAVAIAFVAGLVTQWVTRLVFTYQLEKSLKRVGWIFTGVAGALIVNFLLFKGFKNASFMTESATDWVDDHRVMLLLAIFVLFALYSIVATARNINPLKFVVLMGTFSLAMAFAGNDLVNFIGVSVATLQSYQDFVLQSLPADAYMMESMSKKIPAPTSVLVLAGVVMIITLWTSAKARKVSSTQIGLARQGEGVERFKANMVGRGLVGTIRRLGSQASGLTRQGVRTWTDKRFQGNGKQENGAAFDLVRASVDLMVASSIIAYATSMKQPLSTTYVVFMVGMGSSLADRAWGKESAVYRVSGVINVLGGWIMTAVVAFMTSALFAVFLYYGSFISAMVLSVIAIGLIVRSNMNFNRQLKSQNIIEEELISLIKAENPLEASRGIMANDLSRNVDIITMAARALQTNQTRTMRRLRREIQNILTRQQDLELRMIQVLRTMEDEDNYTARTHLNAFDFVCDLSQSTGLMIEVQMNHLANMHEPPTEQFLMDYGTLVEHFAPYAERVTIALQRNQRVDHAELLAAKRNLLSELDRILAAEVESYRQGVLTTRQSHLHSKLLLELKDVIALTYRVHNTYFG